MANHGEGSEKPTQRRLQKAREEGNFAVSRDFIAAIQLLAFLSLLSWGVGGSLSRALRISASFFPTAFRIQLQPNVVFTLYRHILTFFLAPLMAAGAGLMLITLGIHLASTRFGFASKKIFPQFSRLSPVERLRNLPTQNLGGALQALVLIPTFAAVVYWAVRDHYLLYSRLPMMPLGQSVALVVSTLRTVLWKCGFVLLMLGAVDFFRQGRRHYRSLQMTKQEIREESKESEGNPAIKGQIRRLQRDAARRSMMKAVPKATAIIVNPTHYSVAILYEVDAMAAPRVVAKGKNYLALRIRHIAMEHQVPIIENQPLAQALYKSVDVGQEIPAHLYKAVAEILAYIFRLMNGNRFRKG